MTAFLHLPDMPINSTYRLGLGSPDTLTVSTWSVLQNTGTIIDLLYFASTVEIGLYVTIQSDDDSLIRSTASATSISIGIGSLLTQSPVDPFTPLAPLIDIFKAIDGNYGPGMTATITNLGNLTTAGMSASAIRIADGGNSIYNYGVIDVYETSRFASANAIVIESDRDQTGVNASNLIFNQFGGLIAARSIAFGAWAIHTSHDDDTVDNRGRITGVVELGGGNDVFDNHGAVDSYGGDPGQVFLGDGDDRFTQTGTPPQKFEVHGGLGDDLFEIDDPTGWKIVEAAGEGTDTMSVAVTWSLAGTEFENLILGGTADVQGTGNTAANTMTGNRGANLIAGRSGDDSISGGAGNDLLRGGLDDDLLDGGDDDDVISGGDGIDVLLGGAGKDRLFGDAGQDTLTGGAGRDILWGGADADVFVYLASSDSPAGAGRDAIGDFEIGVDLIDLRAVATTAITWVGTAAFSGTGPEVRSLALGSNTLLALDADGDGLADLQVMLHGATGLTALDLLF